MEGGGLSVMMGSDRMMLMLLVDNWDSSESADLMMCVYRGKTRFMLSCPYNSTAVSVVICEQ